MKNPLLWLAPLLLLTFTAQAETIRIRCTPIPFKNEARINAVVNVSNEAVDGNYLKGAASFQGELRRHINGARSFPVSGALTGRVATATLMDAHGNPQVLKTFFGNSPTGDIARVQLAIGANTGMTSNSFIQMRDGYAYHAKCSTLK